ncbi:MAG: ribosome maturation factor RimP [Clostridia bacterium]
MKVADIVYDSISPLFTGDIRLVEVEYTKKNDGMHLIVYIDKDTGITLEDCVEVNRLIDDKLEELNPTNDESYVLDVSSYGLDKPLKYDWQFKKYMDKLVNVKLYRKIDDRKEFVATLKGRDEKCVIFNINDENISINSDDIAYITPYIEF